jgi:hypothetical protein
MALSDILNFIFANGHQLPAPFLAMNDLLVIVGNHSRQRHQLHHQGRHERKRRQDLRRDALVVPALQPLQARHQDEVRDGGTLRAGDPAGLGALQDSLQACEVVRDHFVVESLAHRGNELGVFV